MTLRLSVVSEHTESRLGATFHQSIWRARRQHRTRALTTSGFYPTRSVTSRANTRASTSGPASYVLVDISSNGTYVNGSQVPLGKYHDYQF